MHKLIYKGIIVRTLQDVYIVANENIFRCVSVYLYYQISFYFDLRFNIEYARLFSIFRLPPIKPEALMYCHCQATLYWSTNIFI